ncbi:MAG: Maf-like protein [Beijerinckiaceae bacterium]|nr:Maf-like protein [Beijerinckiaceae bacterium]
MSRPPLVLASGSPRRLQLLQQIGVEPDAIIPAEIDETPHKGEKPRVLSLRLAAQKAGVAAKAAALDDKYKNAFIIAADTVVAVGNRILPKAELVDEAEQCLRLLSGRGHRVFTSVAVMTPKGSVRSRIVESRVRFKRLSKDDLEAYLRSGDWRGKAGGYAIQGYAGSFVLKMSGSYSAIVGLPLYETSALLGGEGFPVLAQWGSA